MTKLDGVKRAANPFAKLTDITTEHSDKTDTVITLLGVLCDTVEENLNINADILDEKKANHSAWLKATNRRFYISLAAVMVTGAVLYLDVLKLNVNSEIVGGAIAFIKALTGMLL
jgi:hypothetical protein